MSNIPQEGLLNIDEGLPNSSTPELNHVIDIITK